MQIIVLGTGLVGSAIVRDLAQDTDLSVTAVDLDQDALDRLANEDQVKTIQADLSAEGTIPSLVVDCDLVICAVPGFMGFETLKGIIQAGKDVVDISFFAEDAFLLDDLSRANRDGCS
jgi:lysine 6-dehydrogenase